MSYLNQNFLLKNKTAQILYRDYAKEMPIFDYHCHLPEKQILANEPFSDLYEIWLAGDHYKWRLMRNFGIGEDYITGNRTNEEKFRAYCKTLGTAFGNPLYHWSQVELQEFFGCDLEINEANAGAIWEMCNKYIRENCVTPQSLIERSGVKCIFTTNEVFDDLTTFEKIAEKGYAFKVAPAFRGDRIMNIDAKGYTDTLAKLEAMTHPIRNLDELEDALENRLVAFLKVGCRASDIAVEAVCPIPEKADADRVLRDAIAGKTITLADGDIFRGYLTYSLMKLYAKHHVATELHIGAMRNNNSKMMAALGPDSGFDTLSERFSLTNLARLMDRLNSEDSLPKLILFNLNPRMNSELMGLLGCFQSDEAKGKIQYGPAWWFLDNKVGMERHLQDLTATGHLGAFIGMLTDSRSLLSYPRHHYFRRILCNYLGTLIEEGEMTADLPFVGKVIEDICYTNAAKYFGI